MMRETLVAALMFAQPFTGAGSTGGTAPVSPSVMATDMCVVDPAGRGTLELLILWRGSPVSEERRGRIGWWPGRFHGRRAETDDTQRVDFTGRRQSDSAL